MCASIPRSKPTNTSEETCRTPHCKKQIFKLLIYAMFFYEKFIQFEVIYTTPVKVLCDFFKTIESETFRDRQFGARHLEERHLENDILK